MNSYQISTAVVLLLSTAASAQRTPTISYITPDITSKIGGTIEMDCSVLYAAEYPVLWVKLPPQSCDNQERGDVLTGNFRKAISHKCTPIPLSSNSALILRDNRFSMRYDTASATYTLQIKDVQRTDEAIYQCEIQVSTTNKVTKYVNLKVSQPPVILDNSTRSVVVQEGQEAELLCDAAGAPKPQISWRRENNQVLPTGGIVYRGNMLKIHSVKKEDRGTYYCVADNGVGKTARRNVAVDVEFKPDVKVVSTDKNNEVKQAYGYTVELVCYVEAFPRPTITWVHEGIQLSTNQKYIVDTGFATIDSFIQTSVRIRSLDDRTMGKYSCRATNKLGETQGEMTVVRSYTPNCAIGLCSESLTDSGVSNLSKSSFWPLAFITTLLASSFSSYYLTSSLQSVVQLRLLNR